MAATPAPTADKDFDELEAKVSQLNDAVKAGTVATLENLYVDIIAGVKKSSVKCKQLAAINIPLFFKHFPKQADAAINGQLDLCEEQEDVARMTAIRGLPALCEDTPEQILKIADFLGQLLMTENKTEQRMVHQGLEKLLKRDPKSTLGALFNLIKTSEDALRERTISFVRSKLTKDHLKLLSKENAGLEDSIGEQIKEVLGDVDGAEFKNFFAILQNLSKFDLASGKKAAADELMNVLADQADLAKDFDPAEKDTIERLKGTLTLAEPLLARGASADRFLEYLMSKVLPKLAAVPAVPDRVQLLVFLADLGPLAGAESAKAALEATVELIKAHLPSKAADGEEQPEINFTLGETLLFCLHLFARKAPDTAKALLGLQKEKKQFTGQPSDLAGPPADAAERLKDLNARATYLSLRASNFDKAQAAERLAESKKVTEAKKAATTKEEKATVDQTEKALKEKAEMWRKTFENIKKLSQAITKAELVKDLPKLTHSVLKAPINPAAAARAAAGQAAKAGPQGVKRPAPAKPAVDAETAAKRAAKFGAVEPAPAAAPKRKQPEPKAEGEAEAAGAAEAAEGEGEAADAANGGTAKKIRGRGHAKFGTAYQPPGRRAKQ